MASVAFLRGILVTSCLVATLACGGDVPAGQRETRQTMVKLLDFPVLVGVARAAFFTGLAFVLVIFLVAAVTLGCGFTVAGQVLVARRTLQHAFSVCIAQFEFGFVMLEPSSSGLPVALGVALFALLTQGAHMLVILFMAAVAVFRCLFEHGTLVAILTLHVDMFAKQREAALVMIELGTNGLFPTALGVATLAVFAQRLLVLVILGMTGIAILMEFLFVQRPFVARHTGCCDVLAA